MASIAKENTKQTKKLINHSFMGLIVMVALTAIATWFIPAGEFERTVNASGRTVVDPTSFRYIESNPAGIADFFNSFYYGFLRAAGVMAVVTFIGGAFGVLKGLGILNAGVKQLTKTMAGHSFTLFAATIMAAIAAHHSFTGMRELDVVFVALLIPVCLKMGYDTMTAVGVVFYGSLAGFSAALANPFFTGIAHEIAELPMYSGMWYRFIVLVFYFILGLIHISWYAKRVKLDSANSITADIEEENRLHFLATDSDTEDYVLTTRDKIAGFVFLGIFFYMVYGAVALKFGFAQLGGCFMAMALITGLVAGRSLNETCYMFAAGIKEIAVAIFIILFARAVLVIMEDAMIIDTVINFLSQFVVGANSTISATILFFLQCIINFFIPSGSGQAVITMPIITPLADFGGITRQTAVLASQLGDGLTNYVYPTNGTLLAALAVGGCTYMHWFKFVAKVMVVMIIGSAVFVAIGQMIGLA